MELPPPGGGGGCPAAMHSALREPVQAPLVHVAVADWIVSMYPGLQVSRADEPETRSLPAEPEDQRPPGTVGRSGQEPAGRPNGPVGGDGAAQSLPPVFWCWPKGLTLPPEAPQFPALEVWDTHPGPPCATVRVSRGCKLSQTMHGVTPALTMRHGSVGRSHGKCNSSSA